METLRQFNQASSVETTVNGRIYGLQNLPHTLSSSYDDLLGQNYSSLGKHLFKFIDGDFSLIINDLGQGLTLAARDSLGCEPLFYTIDRGRIRFSSLISDLSVGREVNMPFLAEYLLGHISTSSETIYQGVFRLPPGHSLSFESGECRIEAFSQLEKIDLAEASRAEIVELVKNRLVASIDKRLSPFAKDYAIQLSGGIDSSTIFGLSKLLGYEPRSLSMVFEDSAACEREYISAWDHDPEFVPFENLGLDWIQNQVVRHKDLPSYPNGIFTSGLRKYLGSGNLITGYGGDELFSYFGKESAYFKIRNSLADYTPSFLKDLARETGLTKNWVPKTFTKQFISDTEIRGRLRNSYKPPENLSKQKKSMFNCLFHGNAQFMRELEYRDSRAEGINLISPFLDKQLLELCLSIPDFHFRSLLPKSLLREIESLDLPEIVKQRKDKADFTNVAREVVLNTVNPQYLKNLLIYDTSWLNREEVIKDYEILLNKQKGWQERTWSLWTLVSANEFLLAA